jgi:CRP-like cAMP-binding protein
MTPCAPADGGVQPTQPVREALVTVVGGAALDALARRARLSELPREAQLLRAGEVCSTVWLLVRGAVRMCWYRDGREHIGDFHLEGEFVSDYSSFVTGAASRLHLVTTEPSLVAAFSRTDFAAAEQLFPLEVNRGLRRVAEQLSVTFADRIWATLMDSPTERYLALRHAKPAWFDRFPQYMIASYLGLTPEGLSKLRRRLDAEGTPARAPATTRGRTRSPRD